MLSKRRGRMALTVRGQAFRPGKGKIQPGALTRFDSQCPSGAPPTDPDMLDPDHAVWHRAKRAKVWLQDRGLSVSGVAYKSLDEMHPLDRHQAAAVRAWFKG
jgi:hypothetical protein